MPVDDGRAVVVIGAGGHAKVVIECFRAAGWQVIGCTDPDPAARSCAGAPVIGPDEKLVELRAQGVRYAFCALGDNRLRERVGAQAVSAGFEIPSVRGPGALVSPSAKIGIGVAILPGAAINAETVVGDFAIINTKAGVDHDGVISRAAHIGPGARLAGEVHVGERSFLGTGCVVIPKIRIGSDTVVGAGSVVVRNLASGVVAYGNPAQVRGKQM